LQRHGLVDDVRTFRTKPCFTFVTVGSWYVPYCTVQYEFCVLCICRTYFIFSIIVQVLTCS
jgi:hypothetical protein